MTPEQENRRSILFDRGNSAIAMIISLQGNSAIIHESNKYLGGIKICMGDLESDASITACIDRDKRFGIKTSIDTLLDSLEFRIDRALIAIENYVNRNQFNCGYWHPLE